MPAKKQRTIAELAAENAALTARLAVAEAAIAAFPGRQEELRSSRKAALHLMEDAVAARGQAEQAAAELHAREGQLRLFVEFAPAAMALFDADMRYLVASRRWLADYGLTGRDVLGHSHYEIFPDLPESWKAIHRRCLAGAVEHAEEDRFERADGSVQWLQWDVLPWYRAADKIGGLIIFSEDITARKHAADALREREEQLRLALSAGAMATWDWDVPSGRVTWNDEHYRMLGYAVGAVVPSYQAWTDRMHPDDRAATEALLQQSMASGREYTAEFRVCWPDGSLHWLEARGRVERGGTGLPRRSYGVMQDITARKQGEEALAAAHRQLQDIIDNTPAIVYAFDREERFVLANATIAKLLNSTPAQMLGKRRHEFMPRADAAWHEANDRKVLEAGRALDFEEQSGLPGHTITWLTTKFPLRDAAGQIYAVGGISTDITERKAAEEALRLTQASIDGATEMVAWFTPDGRLRYVNDATCRALGYMREELLQMTALDFSPGFTREQYAAHWQEVRERKSFIVETTHRRKDGSEYPAEVLVNYVVYGGQEYLFAYGRDITARKAAEAALARMNQLQAESQRIAHLGSFEYDAATQSTTWSEEEFRIYGLDPAGPSPSYADMLAKCIHPDDAALLDKTFATALRNGAIYELEHRIVRPDGSVRYLYDRAHPHFDEHGHLVRYVGASLDVTDRRQAEEALRASEDRLSRAQEIAHLGSWELDLQSNRLTWSDEVYRIFGLQPQTFAATYEAFLDRVHPEDRARVDAAYTDSLRENRDTYEVEHRIVRQDTGEVRHVLERCEHVRDVKGQIVRSLGMVQDITERKQAEAEMRSLAQFPAQSPSPIMRLDLDGKLVYANIAGLHWLETFGWEVGQPLPPAFVACAARAHGAEQSVAEEIAGPGETTLWCTATQPPGMEHVNLYAFDITKRKRAEAARLEGEERFRAAFEGSTVPMSLTAPDGRLLRVNAAFCRLLGYTEAEMLARTFYDFTYPEDLDVNRAGVQAMLAGAQPAIHMEKRYLHQDGRVLWGDMSAALVRDAGGQPLYMVTHIQDITERKRAEAALQDSEARFRTMANAMPQLAWIARADGFIHWYNQRWYDYTGTTPAQMEGWGWQSVHDPAALPQVLEQWQAAIATGTLFEMTFPLRGADGVFRRFLTRGFPLRDAAGRVVQWFGTNTDVEALQRAEAALRASEERYRSLFQNLQEGFYLAETLCDEQGRCTDVTYLDINPAFEQLMGRPREQIVGYRAKELLPEIKPEWLDLFGLVAQTGVAASHQSFSEALQKHFEAFVFRTAPGRIGVLVSDITARKRAEEALQLSERKFALAFANNPAAIALTRLADGTFLDVNATWVALTGFTRAEALGVSARQLSIWPTAAAAEHFVHTLREQGALHNWEQEFHKKSGEVYVAQLSAQLLTVQGEPVILSTLVDITARKRAEEQLQASEEWLQQVLDATHDGVWDWDMRSGLAYLSPRYYEMSGYQPGEFPPDLAFFKRLVHPDDFPQVWLKLQEQVEGRPEQSMYDYRMVTKSGAIVWMHSRGRVVARDAAGVPLRMVGTITDITERKQAEEQIRAALAEKEVLLKEVHHRVKNNLQVISSLISLQSDNLADERLRAVFGDVRDRVRSMALVHEKLYQSGDLSKVDFTDYAAGLLQYLWRAHGAVAERVDLRTAFAPLVLTAATAVPCGLLLNELVSNALKHAFPADRHGTVTAGVEHDPATGTVCLRVGDDGVGLPADRDWRQAPSLGLRLVQMLADQLGGTIETRNGAGTEFSVKFKIEENKHGQ